MGLRTGVNITKKLHKQATNVADRVFYGVKKV